MSYIIINKKGKQMLGDEFDTYPQALQAHLNMIYGAKLGDTTKGNKCALEYMEYQIQDNSLPIRNITIMSGESNVVIQLNNGKIETITGGWFISYKRSVEIYKQNGKLYKSLPINSCNLIASYDA